jgi:competence protein ComEA
MDLLDSPHLTHSTTNDPRERAAAIFGTAGEGPPAAGVPVFGAGPAGRMRTWLLVRCGLELKTVLALAVVLVVACALAVHHYWAGRPRTVRVPPPAAAAAAVPLPSRPPPAAAKVTIDIAGKVAKPGLRRLPKGSRVADALAAAGGALPGTDTTSLNLARPLADGEQILVGVTPPAATAGSTTGTTSLSLNSATEPQLDALPGVGPVLAQHILDFRTQHGTFTSLQQLRQIPGIGPRKFATLQPLVHP